MAVESSHISKFNECLCERGAHLIAKMLKEQDSQGLSRRWVYRQDTLEQDEQVNKASPVAVDWAT